jgi:dipeptidase E
VSTITALLASNLSDAFITIREFFSSRPTGNLLFIPTAAIGEGWYPVDAEDVQPFRDMGFTVTMFDAAEVDTVPGDFLDQFQAIYVSGGNTFYLLKHLKRTGLFEMIQESVLDGQIVYMGSSAGSVVATPDIGYAGALDDPSLGDGDNAGFGFVSYSILPHMDHESFGPKVVAQLRNWKQEDGEVRPMKDGQVIVITEGREIMVTKRIAS